MKRLWICVAFLAIFGELALADDSDELSSSYYDDWYDMNFDSTEYTDTEKDNENKYIENLSSEPKFRSTQSDKLYDIEDYQIEDNRSEVNEESLDNVAHNTNQDSQKEENTNRIEYLSSKEVNSLGIHSDFNEPILSTPSHFDQENLNFEKKIFEDTRSMLNEEPDNIFSQSSIFEISTEKTTSHTEIFEETSKLLNKTLDTMEEEDIDGGEENSQQPKQDDVKEKTVATNEDTIDQTIADFRADLNKLSQTWKKLNDFDENNLELDDYDQYLDSLTFSEENNTITHNVTNVTAKTERMGELFPDDSAPNKEITTSLPILYLDDALPAIDSKVMNSDIEKKDSTSVAPETNTSTQNQDNKVTETVEEIEVLFTSELNEIMENNILNNNTVWLTVDSPTVITSYGYPNPYPMNAVTDWTISGDGIGIELNVTDLAINGHAGEYLLFKPGGADRSGSTGLIFSYSLHKERRYRFLDVDRMFVRFESRRGPQIFRGFSFSVRMVAPRPEAPEPEPEPAPVIPIPPETITLNLGGVSLEAFLHIEEQFRQIVADMAATYIANNDIEPGLNTTLEMTQILGRALCFHNWPKFEQCVEVTFGVPLVFEDDNDEREPRLNAVDLTNMWEIYSQRHPYSQRLTALGITEYQVPNDRGILTVWLVIAGGVVISMTMLAFALWRFSCFENYTRMPAFSDTDSIKEKRNLDLYPTPHQTLPPLYSETDYRWADAKFDNSTKVHVGGYSNKSYTREDPYDLDSDEDIVPVSARNTSFSPRDIYSV